jgi:hypothetical protein
VAGRRAGAAERLPAAVRERIALAQDWTRSPACHFDAVLQHGDAAALLAQVCAARWRRAAWGPIVGLTALDRRRCAACRWSGW